MFDSTQFDAFAKFYDDFAETIERAPLFEPCEEPPPRLAKIHVTFFKDFAAKTHTTDKLTLVEMQELVLSTARRKKEVLPWLKLAKFGDKRTDKGSLRHDVNVTQISGIEIDYDGRKIAFDDAVKALTAMGIYALGYTSPSHTPGAPRWRILAPTSQPLPPEMRAKLVARLDGFMKAELGVDQVAARESFTLSQAYYYGYVMNKPGLDHRAEVTYGSFIDHRNDLTQYEAAGAKVEGADKAATSKTTPGSAQGDGGAQGFDAILGEIGDGDGRHGFNGPLTRAAASYVAVYFECLDDKKLKKLLRDAIDNAPKKDAPERVESIKRYKGDKYLNGIIQSAIKKFTETLPVTLDHFVADMETHSYIYLPTRKPWPSPSVNARIRPVAVLDVDGRPVLDSKKKPKKMPASEWLDKNRPIEAVTWAPGEPMMIKNRLVALGGWFEHPGASMLNLFRPPAIIPGDASMATLWIDHVRKVYPNDADHIIRWCAYKVQHPEAKINHALFLGGGPGVGKDSLLEPVKRAVGPWNFVEVSPQHIIKSNFTDYLKSTVLRISECRDLGDFDRFAFYEMMKTIIAAPPDVHRINEKHRPEYYIPNVNGIIITSNYLTNGVYLPPDDRRHYVAWSDCTQGDFKDGYFDQLWAWYEDGGDRHVAAYLAGHDLSGFNAKASPKKTEAFFSIANANAAPEEVELVETLDRLGNPKAITIKQLADEADAVPHLQDLAGWIIDRKSRRAIPHRMAQAGYLPVRNAGDKTGLWKILGAKQVVYAQKELSVHDQIKAVGDLIKKADADAKAKSEAEATSRAQKETNARRQAEAEEEAKARLRTEIKIKARARANAEAKRALSDVQRRALELLTRCVNDHGRSPPTSKASEFPPLIRVVALEEWRSMCERGHLSSVPVKEERDRLFWQAKDGLQTANWIACLDGLVWITRDD
ncbi:primase-helicase family protein [Bradyrhizobium sp. WSM2793]|uniref:primase-helicase family protein n=1 Tax=Bradyrhizobium sp. WSM2793 TaxID=1038866 RepID=UPI00036A7B16|nr:primase-helicase family protein [Bradyrhizobium sp. WSM2793]